MPDVASRAYKQSPPGFPCRNVDAARLRPSLSSPIGLYVKQMRLAVGAQAIRSNLVLSHIIGLWTFYYFPFLFNKTGRSDRSRTRLEKAGYGPSSDIDRRDRSILVAAFFRSSRSVVDDRIGEWTWNGGGRVPASRAVRACLESDALDFVSEANNQGGISRRGG
jgi:hypothetical protein